MKRLVFTSDLHGNISLYEELSYLIKRESADILVIGGDLFAYSKSVSFQIYFAKRHFGDFAKDIQIPILFIPGNIDWPSTIEIISSLFPRGITRRLTLRSQAICSHINIIGYQYITPTSMHRKDYERRDLESDLILLDKECYTSDINGTLTLIDSEYLNNQPSIESDLQQVDKTSNVWVTHIPPHGGYLDLTKEEKHVGSKALLQNIRKYHPLLTLHGHVHEAPEKSGYWFQYIGRTLSINPGQNFKKLHAVVIAFEVDGSIKNIRHSVFGDLK